jgi:hypothetical protein
MIDICISLLHNLVEHHLTLFMFAQLKGQPIDKLGKNLPSNLMAIWEN